jgi:hypothetical protein
MPGGGGEVDALTAKKCGKTKVAQKVDTLVS